MYNNMSKYSGRFELTPTDKVFYCDSTFRGRVTVIWNYSTKYDGCQTVGFGKYLFDIFIKQGKQGVKAIMGNIKTFTSPTRTLTDVI